MKYAKKIIIIVLALALIVQPLFGKQSSAVSNDGISVQSITTANMSVSLFIDSDGATRCVAYVSGKPGTTKIAGTLTLKKGTTVVKSWNVSTTTEILKVSKTCYLLSKGTYTLTLKVKVTCDGKTETFSISKSDSF